MISNWVIFIAIFFLNFSFLILLISRQGRSRDRFVFSLLICTAIVWTIANFFADIVKDYFVALVLARITYAVTSIVPLIFLYFSSIFPKKISTVRKSQWALIITFSSFIAILSFTNNIVESITQSPLGINIATGPLYPIFGFLFLSYMGAGFIIIWKNYRAAHGIDRSQIQYLMYGTLLTTIGGAIFNLILPTITGNFLFSKYGPYFTVFLVGFTTIAILRHRLFDIRVAITRSLIFGFLVTAVALGFVFITIVSGRFFGNSIISRNITAFAVAIIIVSSLDPLKRTLSRVTDKVFFKAKIDYQSVLRKLTEVLSVELNLDRLVTNLTQVLEKELKIKSAVIALRKERNGVDVYISKGESKQNVRLPANTAIVKRIRERLRPSILEELERKIEGARDPTLHKQLEQSRQVFEQYGAAVIAPVFSQKLLNAILVLGPKLSGESYSNDDLQLIEVLAPQIGSAIQKANLYEEVREFGERLKKRVEEATAELRERNVSLVTLQQITKDVTRTLDFNRVVQNIADSVTKQLGYLGAVLIFLDDDGYTVRARAITNTPLTNKALKLLPKHFSEYTTDIRNSKESNLANQVITTGQVKFTEAFSDVISPPVPKLLAQGIQKLVGIKTIVIMPIISEMKTVGAMEIGLKAAQEQISEREVETMQSVADQLGIVFRNLQLFERLKQANLELEDANRHLQQLDQAKSEFVSIASHQLRTPMTGIKGYLSMLTDGDFGPMKVEHARILKSLLMESDRMIRLINLFLNVSKIEAGKFEIHAAPNDILPIIEHEMKEVEKMVKDKGLTLTFEKPTKPLPKLLFDADKIQDVLLNLMDNAIKYTKEGNVHVHVESGPGELVVKVTDTGIGIAKDQVGELFNKFVRGSGIARIHPDGSGLGLFIAKRIVEAHHGRIWVESEGEGKGSIFAFALPIA